MKRDSWNSEFRKKRFYENQRRKALKESPESILPFKSFLKSEPFIIPRSIAIMLDLQGTCDKIHDEEAKIFMRQVDTIRKQFGDQKAYICISTGSISSTQIKRVFDILSKYKNDNIVLGTSFIHGGIYDYKYDSVTPMGFQFNMNKIQTFTEYYLNDENLNIGWFALIDDFLSEDVYKSFQSNKAMVGLRPSQNIVSKYNNFMYRTTCTENFLGVIELMEKYINDIDGMTLLDILDEQEEMQRHLSSWELHELIRNCDFGRVIAYLNSGMTDEDDFKDTYANLMLYYQKGLGRQYDGYITELLKILEKRGVLDKPIEDARKLIFSTEDMK